MMNFTCDELGLSLGHWESLHGQVQQVTEDEIKNILRLNRNLTPEEFLTLLSPQALPFLEDMAQKAHALTVQRFGKTIQFYVPLYVSNECKNICTYCGFSQNNDVPRKTLSMEEVDKEVKAIKALGHDHVVILTGEAAGQVDMPYFREILPRIRPHFSHIAFETQPLSKEDYLELVELGLDGVYCYQETYHPVNYKKHHPKGKKSNYKHRLNVPDLIGQAGLRRIGLGVLLGLEDWRVESYQLANHLSLLKKKYWKSKFSISFPRIRPAEGIIEPKCPITDRELVQLITAWRLFDEDLDLALSTRESQAFRDNIFKLGITALSAGSKTSPGEYACYPAKQNLEQFEISDERKPLEVASMLSKHGYEAVWKDWDRGFSRV